VEQYKTKDFFLYQWHENGDLQVMVTLSSSKSNEDLIQKEVAHGWCTNHVGSALDHWNNMVSAGAAL
jgi:hypothetical protein